jgi:hypothetical protein
MKLGPVHQFGFALGLTQIFYSNYFNKTSMTDMIGSKIPGFKLGVTTAVTM